MNKSKLLAALISITCVAIYMPSGMAFTVSPAKYVFDIKPGQTQEFSIVLTNEESEPVNMQLKKSVVKFSKEGTKVHSYSENVETEPAYSLAKYLKIETESAKLNPGESWTGRVTITTPEDLTPGTYLGGVFVENKGDEDATEGIGVTITNRIIINIVGNYLTEDVSEVLSLEEFAIDKNSLEKGKLQFSTLMKNDGDIALTPQGEITIYNTQGEEMKNLVKEIGVVNGETITTGFKDKLSFNPSNSSIFTGQQDYIKSYLSTDQVLNLKSGKYYATLEGWYGTKGEKFEAKSEVFEIKESLNIENFKVSQDSVFDKDVDFEAVVLNNSSSSINTSGKIFVKNAFGQTVDIINLPTQQIELGQSYNVAKTWTNDRGLGLYFAKIEFTYNDTVITSESISFYVINGLNISITALILLIIIVSIVLGIKKYLKMKKKLEMLNKKD